MMYLEEIEYGKISEYDNYYFKENRDRTDILYISDRKNQTLAR